MQQYQHRREARRKESSERAPRTNGALYRHASAAAAAAAGSGFGSLEHANYVNADMPEGAPDPFQVSSFFVFRVSFVMCRFGVGRLVLHG